MPPAVARSSCRDLGRGYNGLRAGSIRKYLGRFLFIRVGIPYHDFDHFRQKAQTIERLSYGKSTITLRQMALQNKN
jgi:hypothetical protein